jgi:imidazolonepropionase
VRNTAPSTLEFNARRHLEAALRHGTTTLESKTGYALNLPGEMKSLRVLASIGNSILSLVPTSLAAHALPPEFSSADDFVGWLSSEFIPKLRERKTARYVDALCDAAGFTADQLRPYLTAAARAGFAIKLQGDQTARAGCVPLAAEFSAVTVAGLNQIGEADVRILAGSPTIATLLPARVRPGMQMDFAPGRALLNAGAAVALASGFHPSAASTFNMQAVVALACGAMDFTVEEALSAATVNAAFAVGQGLSCGTLETGRNADLLILNLSDYREIGLYYGCNIVRLVIRHGEVVCREAPLTCGRS